MTNELILLTGATGFLGHHILVLALQAGYRVRCAVRSAKGIDKILATESVKKLAALTRKISWIIVPDITAPGAYDEAVIDVQYIIHVASPVGDIRTWGDSALSDEEIFVKPAVSGVIGMLESAAAHSPTLKRVVITSSVVAIFPTKHFMGETPPQDHVFDANSRLEDATPPYPPGFAYQASKIAALNASEAWMKKHSAKFDAVSILPAWIFGTNEFATKADDLMGGSNATLLNILKGTESKVPVNSAVVSVHDCAQAHLLALNPSVAGGQAFIAGQLERLEDANGIARKHFPEAFTKGIFSDTCRQATTRIPQNDDTARTVLGLKLQSFEDVVKEVAGQYWELSQKI
ncbi:uncharacterized protein NECHADRAFT_52490 [Fusarium vanettenii 77-13-4]|uniref:NAD-dependent epimerase/dehydratase domain-containing protein n=1 Tax=Fusarium vanettenii (strain ATCC MYA-4622 / CBS 123669 / FGSC 9596 / NRRL 45880 / 77-13-4) TaxID=660122 RepID=C7ZHW9_FUSV7|nr:uncharacterized protein NECHADRAFT_52490 [Fusarium vanettenii 77-13-4]EEU36288.1 hypothetical protein NECHADRAFT_52490 [Fusarium vanettenii 77-13-4]